MPKFLAKYFTALAMASAALPLAAQEAAQEKPPDFSIPRRTVQAFLTAPDSLHLQRIYRSLKRRPMTEADSIGSAVSVQASRLKASTLNKVSGYFWKLYRTHQGGSSCPFEPRVRLRFFHRADTLTADVCFKCDDIDLTHRDKRTRLSFVDWRSERYDRTTADADRLERELLDLLTPLFPADSAGHVVLTR